MQPPVSEQRDYRDGSESLAGQIGAEDTPQEYVAALLDCTREWARVLKPAGSIFVNLGDKYRRTGAAAIRRLRRVQSGRLPRDRGSDTGQVPDRACRERYTIGCIDELGLILRRDIIWASLNATPESRPTDRCATHPRVRVPPREAATLLLGG